MHKQPNSRHCFVCGVENHYGLKLAFYTQGEEVICDHVVPEHYNGYPGVVHGGVVASMLDEMLGRVFMIGDHDRFMYTAKMTTRYRKPVPTEQPLRLVARAVKDRGRVAESKAELYGPQGELLAEAEALLVSLPPEVLEGTELEQLGWRVYPDVEEQR